uniref:Uncharacterized protein n=1 Tax=Poecilia latipinna TaxID=48699 RepID=A0A3B3VEX5_9TELE
MPAPEQSPVTEERLLLTIRDSSAGRKMETDNTANNILASVKEQVCFFFSLFKLSLQSVPNPVTQKWEMWTKKLLMAGQSEPSFIKLTEYEYINKNLK